MRALSLLIAYNVWASVTPLPSIAASPAIRISTFAGSGHAGIRDGAATSSEFILPSALAADSRGNLYVTDAAAQRVRVIDMRGFVSTVAGSGPIGSSGLWVSPGFKDGPALQAQFNRPSGIVVAPDKSIYVADTNNHCLRLIRAGVVSTYAGICGTLGATDGARADALFSYPRQLSADAYGNLYVADFDNAVRKVDPYGVVTTLPLDIDKRVTGVQIDGDNLYVADVRGLLTYNIRTHTSDRLPAYNDSGSFPPPTAFDQQLGSPYALAVGPDTEGVFYTDLRSDSVRHIDANFVTYLSGVPQEDAVLGDGASPLHGPMGIAFGSGGRLFVADSGHKRIVQISGFDRTRGNFIVDPSELFALTPTHSEYRILVLGNSNAYTAPNLRSSIGGLVQQQLLDDGALKSSGRVPRVLTFQLTTPIRGQASLASEIISRSNVDLVLIFAAFWDMGAFVSDGNVSVDLYRQQQADTVAALGSAKIKSLFVLFPMYGEGTPLDALYLYENLHWNVSTGADYTAEEAIMLGALRGIGPPILNLFPPIRDYEMAPGNKALLGNDDVHPSPFGRVFIAKLITKRLEQLRPWETPRLR
ncbi:MAG: hypothetical protein JO033_17935 [Acidobacteriaceae bacterium]|nr:hypothetical protein [Acidobacteriaceae bacterium]